MTITPGAIANACAIIKQFEGCEKRMPDGRLRAYPDPATGGAPWTIGFGSTGKDISPGTIWTQAEADARLAQEVAEKAAAVVKAVTVPATDAQIGAAISLAYNIGATNFANSTLVRLWNSGASKESVADQFLVWRKAAGKVMPGLERRRAAERALFLSA
ncbi:lysozyme [Azospirillum sp. TSO5]|uniref:lysozyme n=1 Tax=Azospirillum sp. TSO5 TaxID=716760 RepID=UPI0018EEAAF6|nr:lysozyme [Azospirillum sp. TSO5]